MNFMERHQVVLYLISMGIGTVIASLGWIGWSEISEMFVPYVLGALLWTNFVLIPLINLGGSGKSQLRKATMLAAALLTPAVTALLVPLFLPAGGNHCSAGPLRGLRGGFYPYCRRGISWAIGGNPLPTHPAIPHDSTVD